MSNPSPPSPAKSTKNVRTANYRKQLAGLPKEVRDLAQLCFEQFCKDPYDPTLENEDLYDTKKGRHRTGSRSIAISRRYRAIYVVDNGRDGDEEEQNCWYWIGSHSDYNGFTGSKKK